VVQVRDGTATLAVPMFAEDLALKIIGVQTAQ
jgi:hypothetical protein